MKLHHHLTNFVSQACCYQAFVLSDAWLQDGTPVSPDALTLKLNTLADRRHSGSHYWIDSGSVYLK